MMKSAITCTAISIILSAAVCSPAHAQSLEFNLYKFEQKRVIGAAQKLLNEQPITVTAHKAARSAGGLHDFFSEGDYWWPDPNNPDGPYIQRDGMTNPENFVLHREAMLRMSRAVSTLTAAYRLSGEKRYAGLALKHLLAWFVDEATKMNPHLKYAQAIKGRVTGRGIGIIDTIHLIEVARAVGVLEESKVFDVGDLMKIKSWFGEYLAWMTTHQYGLDEREAKNNHGTWWVAQVAAFADLVGDTTLLSYCRTRYKEVLLPGQFAADGSFPLEMRRTKPYNYSIFNLEGMGVICWILSRPSDDLWNYQLPDGRSMKKACAFLYPFIEDKSKWTFPKDVLYFEEYPARNCFLLFAGLKYNESRYLETWKNLPADPEHPEVQRSLPLRQPVLWVENEKGRR